MAFSMSGDETSGDIEIPSVFMLRRDAQRLRHHLAVSRSTGDEMFVLLTWIRTEEKEEGEGEGGGGGGQAEEEPSSNSQSSLYDSGEWNEDRINPERNQDSSRQSSSSSSSHSSSDNNSNH